MADRTTNISVSLYNSQVNKIENYLRDTKDFRTSAAFFQYLVDEFFNRAKKGLLRDFMVYMGYPIIVLVLMLYVSISSQGINGILVEKGYYLNELYIQNQIFMIIGFLFLGLMMPLTYIFISKYKKKDKKVNKRKK